MASLLLVRRRWQALVGMLLLSASLAVPVRAAANTLTGGSVTPTSGMTSTVFTFSVHYSGKDPDSVTAEIGQLVVQLSLVSGTAGDGTYRGTAKLGVAEDGQPVTFRAHAVRNDPMLAGPTVHVSVPQSSPPAATPTPPASQPEATASAAPSAATSRPPAATPLTATPLPATPESSASAAETPQGGGFVGGVVITPQPTATPAATSAGNVAEPFGQLWTLITGVLIAAAILGVLAIFAVLRSPRLDLAEPIPLGEFALAGERMLEPELARTDPAQPADEEPLEDE